MQKLSSTTILLITVMALFLGSCLGEDENPCPDAKFTVSLDSPDYKLIFAAENVDGIRYAWYVNGVLIESEDLDDLRDDIFEVELDSGDFTVCIKGESELCNKTIEFCLPVSLEDLLGGHHGECPEPLFGTHRISNYEYKFVAEFPGKDSIDYYWTIDGDTLPPGPDHKIYREFQPGNHLVCLVADYEKCGLVSRCMEINTEYDSAGCSRLYYEYDHDENGNYVFEAEFEGMDSITYKWFVNGDFVDAENYDGFETDHRLEKHFGPGRYEVCIKTYGGSTNCDSHFCKVIEIGGDGSGNCTPVSFTYDHLGDRVYKFKADVSTRIVPYKWFIDGQFIEAENYEGDTTDNVLEKQLSPGYHKVCIKTIYDGCEEYYCQELQVEGQVECRTLSFTGERDGDNLAYKFKADFEGRYHVNYEWSIFVNGEWVGGKEYHPGDGDEHYFYWQFEKGVNYQVCLKQRDCADQKICKDFVIN